MPFFNNPIPRSGMPHFHESTRLRSPRDTDAIGKSWQKNKTIGGQVASLEQNLQFLQQQFNRLRKYAGSAEGATSLTRCKITVLYVSDYVRCVMWDATADDWGTEAITVAKAISGRMITTENVDGDTINYSGYSDDNTRTAQNATTSVTETQKCYPRYRVNDEIYVAKPTNGSGVDGATGTDLEYVEVGTRVWVKQYTAPASNIDGGAL